MSSFVWTEIRAVLGVPKGRRGEGAGRQKQGRRRTCHNGSPCVQKGRKSGVFGHLQPLAAGTPFAIIINGGGAQYRSLKTTNSASSWTESTNTWNGTGDPPSLPTATYVHFTGLTASSFTLKWGGQVYPAVEMNGFQIVESE